MTLSVIIPCRNAVNTIGAQLDALCRQRWNGSWEVLVVDNGSTDGSRDLIKRYRGRLPGLRIVTTRKRGAAHARNAGARAASGEAFVFCDADDEVADQWLSAMADALWHHEFVASRMEVEKLNPAWLAHRLHNVQGFGLRRMPYPPYLRHAGSSGLGIRRARHEEVGGFDETLLHREDTDYCFRVQLRGVELHFESAAVIHIRYSARSNDLFRQARLWAQYHSLLYRRYADDGSLKGCWRSYLRTWRDLIRCLPRTLSRETRAAWMKTLGTQVGLLQGSIKYGVPPICEPVQKQVAESPEALLDAFVDGPNLENR